jgi:hypothetical protein
MVLSLLLVIIRVVPVMHWEDACQACQQQHNRYSSANLLIVTGSQGSCSIGACRRCIGESLCVACPTIVGIGVEVHLTASGCPAITIGESEETGQV